MATLVTIVHVITCVLLVLVVLIQSGKGAEISASLAGSSQTVFGSSGGANFFTRFTSAMAAIFMVTSIALTLLGSQNRKSVFETGASATQTSAPAATSEGQNAVPAEQQKPAPANPADGTKASDSK